MKIVKLISGKEYCISDDEFENLKLVLRKGKLIELSNGDIINPISVSHAGEPDKVSFWEDYPLDKEGRYFMREGRRIYLEERNFGEVVSRLAPEYLTMSEVKLLK